MKSFAIAAVISFSALYAWAAPKADATSSKAKAQDSATAQLKFAREHKRALDLALSGKEKDALKVLTRLTSENVNADEKDRIYLSIGRIQYQLGKLNEALDAYGKVRAGSPSWLEALEERSVVMLRQGRAEDALATLKTVSAPLYKDQIHSEAYFLIAFAQMRICDYKSVFKTLDLFKERYREKVKTWETAGSTDSTTRRNLSEVRETIHKLNLVEAETIQHLYVSEGGKPQAGSPPPIKKEKDQLTFPTNHEIDAKEIWLDEVDAFRVTAKDCPTRTEAVPVARKE